MFEYVCSAETKGTMYRQTLWADSEAEVERLFRKEHWIPVDVEVEVTKQ